MQIVPQAVWYRESTVPLRGHRDSTFERDETPNSGNFWALLQFRAAAADLLLRDHLDHASKNARYTSPDIQNQIIDILGDSIRQKILSQVHKSQFFTLIADELTDCSNKKQLTFLRSQRVNLSKMRGQAYDGAGNMAGKTNGAAALISAEYPSALYLHSLCISPLESGSCEVIRRNERTKHDGCDR